MLFSLYVCTLLEVISSVSQTGTHKTRSLCFSAPSAAMRGTERKVVAFPGPHFPPPLPLPLRPLLGCLPWLGWPPSTSASPFCATVLPSAQRSIWQSKEGKTLDVLWGEK